MATNWGQEKPKGKLLFLVARTSIKDPFFERSVVLIVPLEGEPLIVGLIVNKPAPPPLLKLLQQSPVLKDRSAIAYFGGPVDVTSPAVAFHTAKPPKQAMLLYDDVYLSFDSNFILKLFQDPKPTGEMRLFMGRSQWAPEQLQGEALVGSWYSIRAEGEFIFRRDSERVWKVLHDRAQPGLSAQDRTPRARAVASDQWQATRR